MRWGVSDRAAAAIATAALIDLGLITSEDSSQVIDRMKVRRAKEKLRRTLNTTFQAEESHLSGLYFDGKEVETMQTFVADRVTRTKRSRQEHTVLLSEPEAKFLTHITTKGKTAKEISDKLVEYLETIDQLDTINVIGADSTPTNTGHVGGIIARLEKARGRKVHWSVCLLHTNELPLRHLVEYLDGGTSGKETFKGQIGKTLANVQDWEWNYAFSPISQGPDLPFFPEKVFNNLSSDQRFLYLAGKSIRSGRLEEKLLHLTPGPLCHSRWLTLACRIMMAHMKKNAYTGKDEEKFQRHCIFRRNKLCAIVVRD